LGADGAPLKEGAAVDGEVPDGELPDGACPTSCSADGGQVVDCKGAVVTTCAAGSACGDAAACVPVPWTPALLKGVTVWLRADKGIAPDAGTAVDVWEDQSGKGHHVKQDLATARPAVGTFANGMPAVDFVGSKWMENALTSLVAANSAYTVLTVGQAPATPLGPVFTLRRGPTYSASIFYGNGATMFVHTDGVGGTLVPDLTPTIVVPFQSVHSYFGGTTPLQLYVNGVVRPPSGPAVQTTETGVAGFYVGVCVPNAANPAANQYWNGKIAELVVVEGALLPADRAEWDAYAKARYALP
jgi:hypothetical protein